MAKLLGIHIDSNLSWHTHVEAIASKATQLLYFLKQLNRAGVPYAQLLHFYISVIRPVLEYAFHLFKTTKGQMATDMLIVRQNMMRLIPTINRTKHI